MSGTLHPWERLDRDTSPSHRRRHLFRAQREALEANPDTAEPYAAAIMMMTVVMAVEMMIEVEVAADIPPAMWLVEILAAVTSSLTPVADLHDRAVV